MDAKALAEAFGESAEGVEATELDEAETDDTADEAVSADADVFFDDTEDRATRLEALRRLVRKLR